MTVAVPDRSPTLTRRGFFGTSMLFVGGAALSACQSDPTASGSTKVTLNHWYHEYGEQGTREAAIRYAKDYTAQHQDVAVKVTWVPGDYASKWRSAVLTSQGPDVYEINQVEPDMVAQQQVTPVDDVVGAAKGDFNPQVLAALTQGGKLYAIPMIVDVILLAYRKSLLAKAGLEPPTTFDALVTAAKRLTVGKTKGLYVGNDGIGSLEVFLPWSAGQEVLDGRTITYATPETAAAVGGLRRLHTDKSLLLGYTTEWYDPAAFVSGAAAMAMIGLWALPAITKDLGDDFGVTPWPAFGTGGRPVVNLGGWSQAVNGKSKNVAAAKEYAAWLWVTNSEIQRDWSLNYGFHLPPRATLAAQAGPLKSGQAKQAVDFGTEFGRKQSSLWTPEVAKPFDDAVSNIAKKNADPLATLTAAAKQSQAAIDKLPDLG